MRTCVELMSIVLVILCIFQVESLPQNYEDQDLSIDQPVGEKVDIKQQDPNSNTIHVGHNNPKDSDINIEQTNPFNTTIHVSLNVGTGSKVNVKLENARNVQLHVSFNGMANSECTVDIQKAFNCSVHVSFQNPTNTPVTVTMNQAEISTLHVSQNIPRNSPMTVTMEEAKNCEIHISQAVPFYSPLTWKMTGDPEQNQFAVAQNAADDNSPLDCSPECPQEEYVYDYQYAGSAHEEAEAVVADSDYGIVIEEYDNSVLPSVDENIIPLDLGEPVYPDYAEVSNQPAPTSFQTAPVLPADNSFEAGAASAPAGPGFEATDYQNTDVSYDYGGEESLPNTHTDYQEEAAPATVGSCPGGELSACVDVCPGQFGPRVYGACVTSCGSRCP